MNKQTASTIAIPPNVYQASLGSGPKVWSNWLWANRIGVDAKTNLLVKDGVSYRVDQKSQSLVSV